MAEHIRLIFDRNVGDTVSMNAIKAFLNGLEGVAYHDRQVHHFQVLVDHLENFVSQTSLSRMVNAMTKMDSKHRPHLKHVFPKSGPEYVQLYFKVGQFAIYYERRLGAKEAEVQVGPSGALIKSFPWLTK